MDTINVQREGTDGVRNNRYIIVPRSNFSCNGRITGYMVSLNQNDDEFDECNFPSILVWRPMNDEAAMYSISHTYSLSRSDDINRMGSYYFATIVFTGSDRIEFQSGDVIGYRHRSSPCYTVWSIATAGYTSYFDDSNTININSASQEFNRQPLIQVVFGMIYLQLCNNINCSIIISIYRYSL